MKRRNRKRTKNLSRPQVRLWRFAPAILLILLVVLALVSCEGELGGEKSGEKGGELAFPQSEYDVMIDDVIHLSPKSGFSGDVRYISENDAAVSVSESGELRGKILGDYTVRAEADGCDPVKLTIHVIRFPALNAGDPDENARIYEELRGREEAFEQKLDDADYAGIVLSIKANDRTTTTEVKAIRAPFAMDVTQDGRTTFLLREEAGAYFRYTPDLYSDYYTREPVADAGEDLDAIAEIAGLDLSGVSQDELDLSRAKAEYRKDEDLYTLQAYLKDVLPPDMLATMRNLYIRLGYHGDSVNYAILNFTVRFEDDRMTIRAHQSIRLYERNTANYVSTVDTETSFAISCAPTTVAPTPTLLFGPKTPDAIVGKTDLTEDILIPSDRLSYYRTDLERGLYRCVYIGGNLFRILGSDGKPLPPYAPTATEIDREGRLVERSYDSYLLVPEDGEYLVEATGVAIPVRSHLEKVPLQTVCGIDPVTAVTDRMTGTLEDAYDLCGFSYTAESESPILLRNDGAQLLVAAKLTPYASYMLYRLGVGESLLIRPAVGENLFYITKTEKGQTDFSVALIRPESDPRIGEEYGAPILIGAGGVEPTFTIGEKSMVTLTWENAAGLFNAPPRSLTVKGEHGEYTHYSGNSFLLPAGDYVVTAKPGTGGYCYFRYTALCAEDRDVNVDLPIYADRDAAAEGGYSGLYSEQVVSAQKLRYFFTLTEEGTLVLDTKKISIFFSDGSLAAGGLLPDTIDAIQYARLAPGEYYFTASASFIGDKEHPLPIALCEILPELALGVSVQKITVGEPITLTKTAEAGSEQIVYLSLTIPERMQIMLFFDGVTTRYYSVGKARISLPGGNTSGGEPPIYGAGERFVVLTFDKDCPAGEHTIEIRRYPS